MPSTSSVYSGAPMRPPDVLARATGEDRTVRACSLGKDFPGGESPDSLRSEAVHFHELPFQRRMTVDSLASPWGYSTPTAQAFRAEVAATPLRIM
jgi:hypothetical protein